MGNWTRTTLPGVGDYFQLANNVSTEDVCIDNRTNIWVDWDPVTFSVVPRLDNRRVTPAVDIDRASQALVAFDIYRTTKGEENRGVYASFNVVTWKWNPARQQEYEAAIRQAFGTYPKNVRPPREGEGAEGVVLGGVDEPLLLGHVLQPVRIGRGELAHHHRHHGGDDDADDEQPRDGTVHRTNSSVREPAYCGAP